MRTLTIVLAGLVLALLRPVHADEEATPAPAAPTPLVVAVVDARAGSEDLEAIARTVPLLLESSLATLPGLTLVTRADLDRVQEEQQLNLAGLVQGGQGARVGKLLGADVLILARVTRIDSELLMTAKAIGSETGAMLPTVVRGPEQDGASALIGQLAESLKHLLAERGAELLPASTTSDAEALARVRKEIADLELPGAMPRLAVFVPERHLRTRPVPDPAAETAILEIVRGLGFRLAPIAGETERTWLAKAARGEATFPAPTALAADLVLVGEGFSEFAGRVGRFVSCRARVEIRVFEASTGKIVAVHVGRGSGADLSENFAGKKALEALGREAALTVALDLAKTAKPEAPSK